MGALEWGWSCDFCGKADLMSVWCYKGQDYCGSCFTKDDMEKTKAIKHDDGKPDLSMISWELVSLLGKVRMFGAKKYSRNGWKKGFKVTRSCAAALRHIFQFLSGETNDPESGLPHLGHAVASLEHAIYDMEKHPENDDRGGE